MAYFLLAEHCFKPAAYIYYAPLPVLFFMILCECSASKFSGELIAGNPGGVAVYSCSVSFYLPAFTVTCFMVCAFGASLFLYE